MSDEHTCVVCQRRQYHQAHVCDGCRNRLARHILEIGATWQVLPAALDTNPLAVIDLTYPPIGGAAAVTITDPHHDQNGEIPTAALLDSWARDWLTTLPNIGDHLPAPTVPLLVRWLYIRTTDACNSHPAIDDYAREISRHITRIRNAINLNLVAVRYQAPCPYCGTQTLRRDPGADWIECKSADKAEPGCGRLWGEDEYGLLARAAIPPDELLDTTEAAIIADVEVATIRKWVQRGHLNPSYDDNGKPWYRKIEVENATRRPTRVAPGHDRCHTVNAADSHAQKGLQ